jgi:hypothetical protein
MDGEAVFDQHVGKGTPPVHAPGVDRRDDLLPILWMETRRSR